MSITKIAIIGCGTLGAAIASKLCLKSTDRKCKLKHLVLVDHDKIDVKNFPYLHMKKDDEVIGLPKPEVLKRLISGICSKLKVDAVNHSFPFCASYKALANTFLIDCRDTSAEDSRCSLKVNFDGHFGTINFKPLDSDQIQEHRYNFGNSRYHADVLASIVCRYLFNPEFREKYNQNKYVINLELEELYVI